ncbi:DUF934 domain-containing protein [Spongiibacter sp. KMU-158]|uniref:DUF934 domain-containing protein n=1 Tax=Spongiibacter pelagi TaxID=2760804 RepID=A0A927C346_9GAMM|nr:DUF934 domain-containing protein [Spongiibacter pelagi]MBD2858957.1 DUF934 domain-containing protein [Spongiibacter pelagi]
MPKIIKNREIFEDSWQVWRDTENLPSQGRVIVSLKLWQEHKAALAALGEVGVFLCNESPKALSEDLSELALIAVDFPVFSDGRGFSYARELREQLGYTGELRAIGGFIRDQLCYLARVGFNAFALENEVLEEAIVSLDDFTEFYQASPNAPQPLYLRRSLAIAQDQAA